MQPQDTVKPNLLISHLYDSKNELETLIQTLELNQHRHSLYQQLKTTGEFYHNQICQIAKLIIDEKEEVKLRDSVKQLEETTEKKATDKDLKVEILKLQNKLKVFKEFQEWQVKEQFDISQKQQQKIDILNLQNLELKARIRILEDDRGYKGMPSIMKK
ncbi:hypothetical protein FGO68_gene4896 [Halteria grandinella]|uniref:Uncharacterized protein n=1 Tax=Halteria grandinella TaxID=5974 RepID=A0A8J8SYI2_HALGN|nr:hypothetical protein FGO68_gene4896 [Halteria grandinella]